MIEPNHPFIDHLELCFGKIARGWTVWENKDFNNAPKINVVECRGGFVQGVTVISTLGLGHFRLKSLASEKEIRQELFVMMKDGQFNDRLPAILGQVVEQLVHARKALLRGESIRKPGFLSEEGHFVALYATLPVYYPQELWTFHDIDREDVVLCSLLPIKEKEWQYLRENGWSKFEGLLEQARFDLFDLTRPCLV